MSVAYAVSELLSLAQEVVSSLGGPGVVDLSRFAARWMEMGFWDRARIAYPFLAYEALCEKYASPPGSSPEAEQYWGLAGSTPARYAAEYVSCPACRGYGGLSLGEVSLQPREFALRLALYVSHLYRVVPPTARLGELCKLGYYSVRVLDEWLSGSLATHQLLGWLLGIYAKNSPWTQLREAIFVSPWLKRWLAEAWASYACTHLASSIYHFVAELLRFLVDVVAGLDIVAVSICGDYGSLMGVEGGVAAASLLCSFYRVAGALHRLSELATECLAGAVSEVCSALSSYYASRGRPRFAETMGRYCEAVWGALLGDPVTLLEFSLAYYGAENPMQLHRAYELLSAVSGVPLYAVRRVFAVARALGQWGYPAYLGGGI